MSQTAKKYEFPSPLPVKQEPVDMGSRQFPNDWYLLAYQTNPPKIARKLRKQVLFSALGVALTAAVLTCWIQYRSQAEAANKVDQIVQQSATLTSLPVQVASGTKQDVSLAGDQMQGARPIGAYQSADASASSGEAQLLKARNRRLEALVKVLRQRTVNAKSVPAKIPLSR